MEVSVTAVFLAGIVTVLIAIATFVWGIRVGSRTTLMSMAGEIYLAKQLQTLYFKKLQAKGMTDQEIMDDLGAVVVPAGGEKPVKDNYRGIMPGG